MPTAPGWSLRGVAVDWSPLSLFSSTFEATWSMPIASSWRGCRKGESASTSEGGATLPVSLQLSDIDLPRHCAGARACRRGGRHLRQGLGGRRSVARADRYRAQARRAPMGGRQRRCVDPFRARREDPRPRAQRLRAGRRHHRQLAAGCPASRPSTSGLRAAARLPTGPPRASLPWTVSWSRSSSAGTG